MKVALILDDESDSLVIVHLLLEHQGYEVMVVQGTQEGLRILLATPRRFVVVVGDTLGAMALLTIAADTLELQRHAYVLLMDRGEPLPTFTRQAVFGSSLLIIQRPLRMAHAVRAIEFAGQCI